MERKLIIQVSNDTFHSGNGDAWVNVLNAYEERYPSFEYYIDFEGEILRSPHQLYRWGRIFNGYPIHLVIKGTELKNINYLKELLKIASSKNYKDVLPKTPGWTTPFFHNK